jgi:hypothetical protein
MTNQPFTFTPGNYTTRDGRKARVFFRLSEPTDSLHPLIGELEVNGRWMLCAWTVGGQDRLSATGDYGLVPHVTAPSCTTCTNTPSPAST